MGESANLVVSYYHLVELSSWTDTRRATELIHWLDSIDTVWSRLVDDVRVLEEDSLILALSGDPNPPLVEPFAPCRLAVLSEIRMDRMLSALLSAGLIGMFEALQTDGQLSRELTQLSRTAALTFHADRNSGVSAATGRQRVDDKKRGALLSVARDAWSRTDAQRFQPDREAAVLRFFDAAYHDPRSLPSVRVFHDLQKRFGDAAALRNPGSNKFQKFQSTAADIFHAAIGVPYCDVFTCDKETSSWLGDFRTNIGHARQLAEGEIPGGSEGFVKALIASI